MLILTENRRKRISEIFGNLAVAWFAAGVIAPIFIKDKLASDRLVSFTFGFVEFLIFLYLSLVMEDNYD